MLSHNIHNQQVDLINKSLIKNLFNSLNSNEYTEIKSYITVQNWNNQYYHLRGIDTLLFFSQNIKDRTYEIIVFNLRNSSETIYKRSFKLKETEYIKNIIVNKQETLLILQYNNWFIIHNIDNLISKSLSNQESEIKNQILIKNKSILKFYPYNENVFCILSPNSLDESVFQVYFIEKSKSSMTINQLESSSFQIKDNKIVDYSFIDYESTMIYKQGWEIFAIILMNENGVIYIKTPFLIDAQMNINQKQIVEFESYIKSNKDSILNTVDSTLNSINQKKDFLSLNHKLALEISSLYKNGSNEYETKYIKNYKVSNQHAIDIYTVKSESENSLFQRNFYEKVIVLDNRPLRIMRTNQKGLDIILLIKEPIVSRINNCLNEKNDYSFISIQSLVFDSYIVKDVYIYNSFKDIILYSYNLNNKKILFKCITYLIKNGDISISNSSSFSDDLDKIPIFFIKQNHYISLYAYIDYFEKKKMIFLDEMLEDDYDSFIKSSIFHEKSLKINDTPKIDKTILVDIKNKSIEKLTQLRSELKITSFPINVLFKYQEKVDKNEYLSNKSEFFLKIIEKSKIFELYKEIFLSKKLILLKFFDFLNDNVQIMNNLFGNFKDQIEDANKKLGLIEKANLNKKLNEKMSIVQEKLNKVLTMKILIANNVEGVDGLNQIKERLLKIKELIDDQKNLESKKMNKLYEYINRFKLIKNETLSENSQKEKVYGLVNKIILLVNEGNMVSKNTISDIENLKKEIK